MSYFRPKCSIPYLWDLTLDWPLLPNQKVPGVSVCQLCTSTGLASHLVPAEATAQVPLAPKPVPSTFLLATASAKATPSP